MKLILALIIPLFGSLPSQDEVGVLQELIEITRKNLVEEERLLKLIVEYKKAKEAFIVDSASSRLATSLVWSAQKLKKEVDSGHLSHLISESLLEEVRFFSGLAK